MIKLEKVNKGRGYVYCLHYHIVWCVKYRNKILTGDVDANLKQIVLDIAADNDITVLEMATDRDHIHLLVSCKPQHDIPSIMKVFKGASARRLFQKHPELKQSLWGGHMWNPSYFIATASDNTEDQIRHYIQNQQINHK